MTEAARHVLSDCELAIAELEPTQDGALWRRRWVAALVLLRSVGHVLTKVDGVESATYRSAIDAWWKEMQQSKPYPPIFWSFIEKERNAILKQYKTKGVHIARTTIRFNMATGERMEASPIYLTMIEGGVFDGRPQVEVGNEAVVWWRLQLDEIDAQARREP